ncbi:hypothetical protein MMC11_006140 [Xylographa trunciseda]|nr:hypothetical protein [Xylographa trunciseda]
MVGIPFCPELNFDLFDALGLDPTKYNITEADISAAWPRICQHIEPTVKNRNYPNVPVFPTFDQARRAFRWFLVLDYRGYQYPNSIEVRIRIALCEGRADFESTWNPFANPGSEAVLHPVPGLGRTTLAVPQTSLMSTPSPTPSLSSSQGLPLNPVGRHMSALTEAVDGLNIPHDAVALSSRSPVPLRKNTGPARLQTSTHKHSMVGRFIPDFLSRRPRQQEVFGQATPLNQPNRYWATHPTSGETLQNPPTSTHPSDSTHIYNWQSGVQRPQDPPPAETENPDGMDIAYG